MTMTGTEQQVTWAESIKAEVLRKLDFAGMTAKCKAQRPDQLPMVEELQRRSLEYFAAQDEARWWIEVANRQPDARQLIAAIHAEVVAAHPREATQ